MRLMNIGDVSTKDIIAELLTRGANRVSLNANDILVLQPDIPEILIKTKTEMLLVPVE